MTRLSRFSGVLFDLDGTLVDLHVDWTAVRAGLREALVIALGRDIPALGVQVLVQQGLTAGDPGVASAVWRVLGQHEQRARFSWRPGALELLQECGRRGPLGVVSNNLHATATRVLDAAALPHPPAVVGLDDVGRPKPDPRGVQRALAALGASPAESVLVGDQPTDAEAAKQAGVHFIHVDDILGRP